MADLGLAEHIFDPALLEPRVRLEMVSLSWESKGGLAEFLARGSTRTLVRGDHLLDRERAPRRLGAVTLPPQLVAEDEGPVGIARTTNQEWLLQLGGEASNVILDPGDRRVDRRRDRRSGVDVEQLVVVIATAVGEDP